VRLWRLIRWLGVAMIICFTLLFVDAHTYYVARVTGDAMDWRSRLLAGFGSVTCGRVPIRGDASAATQCALKANAEGKPFRVTYNIQGIDEEVAGGIVRTPQGRLLGLSFYGCPIGCGFSFLAQRVTITECPQPYHLYVNPKGRINCFQMGLSYPKDIMSPNFEPY
jgi:hypothetical protein